MWNVQTEVIPVIIGERENTYKSIRKYLKQRTGKAQTIRRATYRESTDNTQSNIPGKHRQYVEQHTGKARNQELKNTTVLGNAHTLSESTNVRAHNI